MKKIITNVSAPIYRMKAASVVEIRPVPTGATH